MIKRFVFLEIIDYEIDMGIRKLKHALGMPKEDTRIHVTVRGPYKKEIRGKQINNFHNKIKDDPIIIQGAGRFDDKKYHVVYLKVENRNLEKIWWKPDYPIKKYGYHPHISIYRGNNEKMASEIYEFLKSENIMLMTDEFHLTSFVSKQDELFNFELEDDKEEYPYYKRRISDETFQRASNIYKNFSRE